MASRRTGTPTPAKTARRAPAPAAKRPKAASAKPPVKKASAAKSAPPKPTSKPTPKPAAANDAAKTRSKLVRDSFTFPKDEYEVLAVLKKRLALQGHVAKKTEVLRAALVLLASLDDAALLKAARAVPVLPTGRPKKKG